MRTGKEIHIDFCNYMVQKATAPILTVKKQKQNKYTGIKTNGLTRNELINALAEKEDIQT